MHVGRRMADRDPCSSGALMHVNVGHLKSYKHSPTRIPFLFLLQLMLLLLLLLLLCVRFSPASFQRN